MTFPVLIGGHRGLGVTDNAKAQALRDTKTITPENTIEALTGAFIHAGADFIEFDVVPSHDGLVVTHSAKLSDHIFPPPAATHTTQLTTAAITALTTGHRGAAQDKVPTLEAALAALAPIVLDRPGRFINLEMKEVQNSGRTWSLDEAMRYAEGVGRAVSAAGLFDRTLFSSFNSANLQVLLHFHPDAKIAQLFDVPEDDGKPIYGDPGLARYMAFTPKNVAWTLANMPDIAGLNPPVQAFRQNAEGMAAMQTVADWAAANNKQLPGIYIWALGERPVSEWQDNWQRALDISAPSPRRALITDYPAEMRAMLTL